MNAESELMTFDGASEASQDQGQIAYLVFSLDECSYAIEVEHVSEIIASVATSPVPGAPDYLKGVTNLRGRILPMVDMRKRFQLQGKNVSGRDCYIILMMELEHELVELGIRVDSADEVIRLAVQDVGDAGSMSNYVDKLVFNGVARTETGVKLVLDAKTLIQQLQHDVRQRYGDEREKQLLAIEA